MTTYLITAKIAVEAGDDPEYVASVMANGLANALDGFPAGEIVGADVELIEPATQAVLDEHGWNE